MFYVQASSWVCVPESSNTEVIGYESRELGEVAIWLALHLLSNLTSSTSRQCLLDDGILHIKLEVMKCR